jgi:phosphoribosylaminoimidazole-succinocarboxamide synthase
MEQPLEANLVPFRKGKVKDVYQLGNDQLVFVFTDRVSAYDVILPSTIPRKGEVLCKLAAFLFEHLGVPHHMIRLVDRQRMIVKRLKMIPVECVVRGYLYGNLYQRQLKGDIHLPVPSVLGARLPEPIFDPTTKSDVHDESITLEQIEERGILTSEEIDLLVQRSIGIYKALGDRADKAGFILADIKLEFGFDEERRITLADSIGPDEFRLWPKTEYVPGRIQDSYDKQPIRDWLAHVGYKKSLDEARGRGQPTPTPPELPQELIEQTSGRYVTAYELLTGMKL